MAINIYRTQTILAALQLMKNKPTFLRDRYFPTSDRDIFVTEDVLVEYMDEEKRVLAPVVVPLRGGIPVGRTGYHTERFTPPYVAPERPLTVDDLNKKQFGETLFSQRKPAAREGAILNKDITDLNEMIDGREEFMAARTLFDNGYRMKAYADSYGGDKYEEFQIQFYDGETNPAVYMPTASWSRTCTTISRDLFLMAKMLKDRGLNAADVLFGDEVSDVIINNEYIQKLMDNRRLDLIQLNPVEYPNGVTCFGRINCSGVVLTLFCYSEKYVDEKGKKETFIPEGKVCVTAPGVGRTLYGAVTQMEQADNEFHTYSARRVPHIVANAKSSIRTLTMKARPLTIPNYLNSSITATVLF